MIHYGFTVHDVKADAYLPGFWVPNVGLALRAFSDCINSDTHQFAKHPADYTLFKNAEFDDETGEVRSMTPQSMGNGVEFIDNTPPRINPHANGQTIPNRPDGSAPPE